MERIKYIPNRVIDTNGISDGAALHVYQSGTTTHVPLFADEALSVPTPNPMVVPSGAEVPVFYTSYDGDLRLAVIEYSGVISMDEDPYDPVIGKKQLIAPTGASLIGLEGGGTVQEQIQKRRVTMRYLGVSDSSSANQFNALQNAFDAARSDGLTVIAEPNTTYFHEGQLTIDSFLLDLQGATLAALTDVNSGLRLTGTRPGLINGFRTNPATVRGSGVVNIPVLSIDATDILVRDITIIGAKGGGMAMYRTTGGRVQNVTSRDTMADGIHMTDGTSGITLIDCKGINNGDDAISIVSYSSQSNICQDIRVISCYSEGSKARGMTVIGGRRIQFSDALVRNSRRAGVLISSESSYVTYGCQDVTFQGQVYNPCISTDGEVYAGIQLSGRSGTTTASATGEVISNQTFDCGFYNTVVRGNGQDLVCGARGGNNTVRSFFDNVRLQDLRLVTGTTRIPDGFHFNGQDMSVRNCRMDNIGGIPIVVNSAASGTAEDFNNKSSSCGGDTPVALTTRLIQASALTGFNSTDAVHETGSGVALSAAASSGSGVGQPYRQRNFRMDGKIVRDTNAYGDWAYDGTSKYTTTLPGAGILRGLDRLALTNAQTFEMSFSPRHSGEMVLNLARTSGGYNSAYRRERWYVASAGTGTAGVDYVSIGGGNFFQRDITTPGCGESQFPAASIAYTVALTYNSGTSMVTMAFTPGANPLDISIDLNTRYRTA